MTDLRLAVDQQIMISAYLFFSAPDLVFAGRLCEREPYLSLLPTNFRHHKQTSLVFGDHKLYGVTRAEYLRPAKPFGRGDST